MGPFDKAQRICFKCRLGQSHEQGETASRGKSFKSFQWGCEEFIWVNSSFKEEPKSNQVFEGIGANKEIQKSINIIMPIDGNNPHYFSN